MKRILFLVVIILYFQNSFSQSQIRFERLNIEDGLSQSTVFCIHQDSKGFMWFGTSDGLNKYDGYKFVIYKSDPEKPNSISSNYINCIFEDSRKRLWIGTRDGGLNLYEPKTETFKHFAHDDERKSSLANNTIYQIYETHDSALWLASNGGLSKLIEIKENEAVFENYTLSDDKEVVSKNYVRSIFEDENRTLWVGAFSGGLSKFDRKTKTFTRFSHEPENKNSITPGQVKVIFEDSKGELWVGTQEGLNRFNRERQVFIRYTHNPENPKSISSNRINAIWEDKWGQLWIGTYGGGLNVYDRQNDAFIHYTNNPSVPTSLIHDRIWTIYGDEAGVLWVGTLGGISKYDKSKAKFEHFTHIPDDANSLSHKWVWAFNQDQDGVIWIGTQNGLTKFDPVKNEFDFFRHEPDNPNSLSHNSVKAIWQDKNGILWIGTRGGLDKFNPETGKFKSYRYIPDDSTSLNHNDVRAIYRDSYGVLWVGTFDGGLDKFDDETETFTHHIKDENNPKTISNEAVWLIYEDRKQRLWIGTFGGGLNRYIRETGSFIHYKHQPDNTNSISDNNVRTICEDIAGRLWIGTSNGLNLFDPESETFTWYKQKDGLPNNVIYGILSDDNRNLWMSTNNGLSRFNPASRKFKNFTEKDGLQSNEFNGGAYYKNKNGKMFFGGINGFNMFYPDSIKNIDYEPNVVITDFLIYNKSVPIGEYQDERVVLQQSITETDYIGILYSDYTVSFEFAALHYSSPEKNYYMYKLEGLDDNWITTDADKRFATYTKIQPGEYEFKVKGTNSDGVWSQNVASVTLRVQPPFWQTWWFRITAVILILGGAYSWYWSRINRIKKQKIELERQVKERTAEIARKNQELEKQKAAIEQSYRNVKRLSEIGHEITVNLSVERIINTVNENVNQLMDASVFGIGIYNPTNQTIDFSGTKENGKILPFYCYDFDDRSRLASRCFKQSKEILISDFENEFEKYIDSIKTPKAGKRPMSIIYIPLSVKDKKIGVITVQSFKKDAYTDYHLDILRNISVYTAIALDNADAYFQIERQAKRLAQQADELKETNDALSREKEYTMGSIRYAKTIQNAILPSKNAIEKHFETFILFRPKDIVSGDFYWFEEIQSNGKTLYYAAVIDCTGHGVPGAFMSMIGNRLLNNIVIEKRILKPADILNKLNEEIIKALKQNETDNNDGMDLCLCVIEKNGDEFTVQYSGAKRSLLCFDSEKKRIRLINANRFSIGGYRNRSVNKQFEDKTLKFNRNDVLYLTTDGYVDQNAPDRKRFGTRRLLHILQSIGTQTLDIQKTILDKELDEYMQNELQRDDITIVGFRLK